MPICESCQAEVLSDAQFCEACGHRLGTPTATAPPESKPGSTERLATTPGSLRSEIPFLTGAVDQAKVRLDNWKKKGDQARQEAERQADLKKQEAEIAKQERSGKGMGVINFLVGLLALAAFIYILVRMPRKGSPTMIFQLWEELRSDL